MGRSHAGAGDGRGEVSPRDKPPTAADRDQFADLTAIPGNGERLPTLHRVHNLPGFVPQIPLGDLRLRAHDTSLPKG
jgi:hypothetical protein